MCKLEGVAVCDEFTENYHQISLSWIQRSSMLQLIILGFTGRNCTVLVQSHLLSELFPTGKTKPDLHSTKQQTHNICNELVNRLEHLATKETPPKL